MSVKISTMGRAALVVRGLLVSACAGGRQVGLPVDAGSQLRPAANRHPSWMSPAAKTASLAVYIADGQGVDAYAYKTHALLGQLTVEGADTLCSDKSGNIWVNSGSRNGAEMLEYAPGGTQPIAELFSYPPTGCAVDPDSGDLAVVTGATRIASKTSKSIIKRKDCQKRIRTPRCRDPRLCPRRSGRWPNCDLRRTSKGS